MRILGIDPGATGAMALLEMGKPPLLIVRRLPSGKGRTGKLELIEAVAADMVRELAPDLAYVELVHSMPKQGVTSTFNFGVAYGVIRGVLGALRVPFTLISPHRWGALVRLPIGEGGSRIRAAQLFPDNAEDFRLVKDHDKADACLIALAGHRDLSPF